MKKFHFIFGLILLIGIALIVYKPHAEKEVEVSEKTTPSYKINTLDSKTILIGHAGGSLKIEENFIKITDSKEALEQSYQQGIRIFELDLILTSDDQLVARHDWEPYLYEEPFLGQKDHYRNGQSLTHKEFMNTKIQDKYPPMDIHTVISFLVEHPDVIIITDTKSENIQSLEHSINKIAEAVGENNQAILDQFIPQVYDLDQFDKLKTRKQFKRIILTLYLQKSKDSLEAIEERMENNQELFAVTISQQYFQDYQSLINTAHQEKVLVFVHTINDLNVFQQLKDSQVDGIYTDYIRERDDKLINITSPSGNHFSAYWENYGLVINGRIPADQEITSKKESSKKVLEFVDETNTVVNQLDMQNVGEDGYQAILSEKILNELTAGSYTFQISVITSENTVKTSPIELDEISSKKYSTVKQKRIGKILVEPQNKAEIAGVKIN